MPEDIVLQDVSSRVVDEPDTDVDFPGRPSVCLVCIHCHSFS